MNNRRATDVPIHAITTVLGVLVLVLVIAA